MDPMTPNTAAFFNMLASAQNDPDYQDSLKPTALPASAFFTMPVPGRDTPEDSPQSSISGPPNQVDSQERRYSLSDDSGQESPDGRGAKGDQGNHKRKAGRISGTSEVPATTAPRDLEEEDDDDDSEGDSPSGHEGKRQHQSSQKATGRGGRRKSGAGGDEAPAKGKDASKAAKRKEQNRAAQKAFRERREARVKDLESKVAELEAKSFGATVENENLRGILKRLQEENVALKQSAFTFSVPLSGSGSAVNSNINTPAAFGQKQSRKPINQVNKPPSPPHTISNDSLRSIDDVPDFSHGQSQSSGAGDSPDSLASIGSSSSEGRLGLARARDSFNQTALAGGPCMEHKIADSGVSSSLERSPTDQFIPFTNLDNFTPSSTSSGNKSEVDALWASFYPNGIDSVLSQNQNPTQNFNQNQNQNQSQNQNQHPNRNPAPQMGTYTYLNSQPELMSFPTVQNGNNVSNNRNFFAGTMMGNDKMAFRDSNPTMAYRESGGGATAPNAASFNRIQNGQNQLSGDNWADLTDNSVSDFLASLSGGGANDPVNDLNGFENDDAFNAQLQQIFATATNPDVLPTTFGTPSNNVFSPTNYLNMSPSPLNSISNSQSPTSMHTSGGSNSESPNSSGGPSELASIDVVQVGPSRDMLGKGMGTFGPAKSPSEIVHIISPDGQIVKPSKLWAEHGYNHLENVDHLMIDDLCDQMKAKATTKDGTNYITLDEAKNIMKFNPTLNPAHYNEPINREKLMTTHPEQCQQHTNERFIAAAAAIQKI